MPTYVYQCLKCKQVIETVHRMIESPRIICEKCKEDMKKVIQSSSFVLKGSGWEKDGY
jgi:putative FmdB family regulatory protein